MKTTTRILALAGAALGAATVLTAGPTNPPAGPIGPTYKTLAEVEPRTPIQSLPATTTGQYVITQPGSYYLTGDVAGVTGKTAIEVRASNVTIDLNGFSVVGVPGAINGIRVVSASALTLRNGRVSGWPQNNIEAGTSANCRFENVKANNSAKSGLSAGYNAVITGCQADANTEWGLFANDHASVSASVATGNGKSGFRAAGGSSLVNCAAGGNGEHGFEVSDNSTLSACSADRNTFAGFRLYSRTSASGCAASDNGADGFFGNDGLTFTACTASLNDGDGIHFTGAGSTITGCTANDNGEDGIHVTNTSLVTTCNTARNGVLVTGSGIHLVGNANRVDGCGLNSNDVGVTMNGGGNLVVRSSFTFNPTRVSGTSGNNVAEIIVTPGDAFVSTNAWANFGH